MQYTEDRAKVLDWVATPYDRSGGAAVGRKDSGLKDWADLKGKPVCVSQGSNFTQPLIEQYGAEVKGLPSQPESLLALQGGNCVAAVHVGATVGLLLEDRPEEWKDYTILFPTELLPSDSVIWVRKGEKETAEALDKSIRQLHTSEKLLEFAKANRLRNTDYLEQERKTLSAGK